VRYAGGAVDGRWVCRSSRDWIVVDEVDAIGVSSIELDMVVGMLYGRALDAQEELALKTGFVSVYTIADVDKEH
jgi:hypothetical protein